MKYEIKGGELPVVVCFMDAGETMITEKGSMSWMSPNMKMETTSNGGVGKALGRMFAGDIVNGTVAVRMVFTHRIADDTRALSERLVVLDAELIHVIQSTALYRL